MKQHRRKESLLWPHSRFKDFIKPLRKTAAVWFKSRSFPVQEKYPYILGNRESWRNNIILTEVADYVCDVKEHHAEKGKAFPLHKFIHHGLSSQGMLFNLMGPLIIREDLAMLRPAFDRIDVPWPKGIISTVLEMEDREIFNENFGQPTSIDLVISGSSSPPSLFIEAKFVEQGFGGCSVFKDGDCDGRNPVHNLSSCYLHRIGRTYWTILKGQGFLQGAFQDSPICILANYYQYFREVAFAVENGGYFILLHDARNPVFVNNIPMEQRGLWPFLMSFIPMRLQDRVKRVTIQEIFDLVRGSETHRDWAEKFAMKYGLAPAKTTS